jgi:hypothetical protein
VYKVNLFIVGTFVFDDPATFCLGKGGGLLLLGSSSSKSGMMISTLLTNLLTTLSWFQLQLVHTNIDMVICQLEATQKHSHVQISLTYIENEHAMYLNCNCLCTYFGIANGIPLFSEPEYVNILI